jgi:hypothetical protein
LRHDGRPVGENRWSKMANVLPKPPRNRDPAHSLLDIGVRNPDIPMIAGE